MKKTITSFTFSLFLIFVSNLALAKTSGHVISLDLLRTQTSFEEKTGYYKPPYVAGRASNESYRYGFSYGYAFSVKEIFLAPKVFFENNNVRSTITESESEIPNDNRSILLKNRYGLALDVGLDITESLAPYLTLGLAKLSYETAIRDNVSEDVFVKKSNKIGGFFGAGLKLKINKDFAVHFEWQSQRGFVAQVNSPADSGGFDVKTNIMKLGFGYYF